MKYVIQQRPYTRLHVFYLCVKSCFLTYSRLLVKLWL